MFYWIFHHFMLFVFHSHPWCTRQVSWFKSATRGVLGMPRHRKTRLLHWPAYRLLFHIRVLDWRLIVSFPNRETCLFFSHQTFFLTLLKPPRLLIPGCWNFQFSTPFTSAHFAICQISHLTKVIRWGKSSPQRFGFQVLVNFFFLSD